MEKQRKEIKELWKQEQNKMVSIIMEFHLPTCEHLKSSAVCKHTPWKMHTLLYSFSKMLVLTILLNMLMKLIH